MGKITIRVLAARIFAIGLIAVLMLTGTAIGDVSRNGLVAEWHFDGDAKDSSGNGNDGTIYGATFIDGKFGKALSFNGVDNYVMIQDNDVFSSQVNGGITLSAWIKPYKYCDNGDQSRCSIISKGGSTWEWALYEYSSGAVDISVWGSNPWCSSAEIKGGSGSIQIGKWQFLVGTYDSTEGAKTYVDGNLVNSTPNNACPKANGNDPVLIGRRSDGQYVSGIIDEVRIYSRALSAEEIKANYEAGQIIITSNPSGAEVLVDGNSKGIASPTLSVDGASPGTHTVKCKLSGYQDYDTNVVLSASSVASVNCALSPVPTSTPTSTASIQKSTSSSSSSSPIDTITPVPTPKEPQTESKPLLSLSQDPFTFNFGTMKNGETASQVFSVSNAGGETLTWGISDDQSWITANPTSGINSGTVLININTAGLNPGSYSGTIIVTSNGGTKKGSVLLNIPDTSAAPVDLPIASPVSLSQIVGVILVLGGLLLTTLTTVKKDISLEVGVSEKTLKYVGGAGVLLVMIGAYMLLKTSGFM